jgi:6-phosphogluconolactonase/glucosamine-6-phosphate isomerase/deaminase
MKNEKKNFILVKKNFNKTISSILEKKIKQNRKIFLCGGNSVKQIYKRIYISSNKKIFLTDDRVVKNNNKDSNYFLLKSYFKKNKIIKIYNDNISISENLIYNEKKLPKYPDLVVLSLGDDGHLASLFKKKVKQFNKKSLFIKHKNYDRISLSHDYILKSKNIIIIINTLIKKKIFIKIARKKILNTKFYDKLLKSANWYYNI